MKKRLMIVLAMMYVVTSLPAQQITRAEYFFNTDPGQGLAIALPVTAGDSVTINSNIPIPASLQAGINILFVRTADNNNSWSFPEASLLWISNAPQKITALEYFFDTDPGIGTATPIVFSAPADSASIVQNITVPALSIGTHTLYVRTKNTSGVWSFPEAYTIHICTAYGPTSVFTHYIYGGQVFFTDSSVNAVSRKWLFGDNTSDTSSNPRHIYASGNNYDVKLITTNSCGNDTLSRTIGLAGVQSIYPHNAPETGIFVGYIKGVGFMPGSTATLKKSGATDIVADTTIFIDSTLLKMIIKNSNETLGVYDLSVDAPSSGTMVLANAVTIEPATPFNITASLEGRREVLINRWASFRVVCTNNGNKAALGVPVVIKMSPNVQARLINPTYDSTLQPEIISYTPDHFYVSTDSTTGISQKIGYFILPYLEAGMSTELLFEIKTTTFDNIRISVATGNPFFYDSLYTTGRSMLHGGKASNPITGYYNFTQRTQSVCDPPPCLRCIMDILGFAPGVGCAVGAYSFFCSEYGLLNSAFDKNERVTSAQVVDFIGQAGGAALSCIPFSLTVANAIKSAADAANMASGIYGTVSDCATCLEYPTWDSIKVRFAWDPNVKAGPTGYNTLNYTRWQNPFNYIIHFENQGTATAPAAEVVVTDYLDTTKLDINSFRFAGFGFADTSLRFDYTDTTFIKDVDLRPGKNAILRVTGRRDSVNKISFRLTTLDPATMQLVTDISQGFLDPNVDSTEGTGYVAFRVRAKSSLVTGDIINNNATIIFDANAPITTNTFFNGIDKTKPASNILPITGADRINDTTYTIRWVGTDAHAGVRHYFIYVSVNDSAYRLLRLTDSTQIVFRGRLNSNYKFFSIAEDLVGNIEDAPAGYDQQVTMSLTPLPVTWLAFNAYKKDQVAKLEWSTATEQNNLGFEIQRSIDGLHFVKIGFVNGAGNSSVVRNYIFIDSTPARGMNYYRLKQINADGATGFSAVRQVKFGDEAIFTVHPNPAKDKLVIEIPGHDVRQLRITDVAGHIVWQAVNTGSIAIEVSLERFTAGVYFVQVINKQGSLDTKKFVKE